jgi:type VI secretion system protein ImpM
VHTVGLFGKLPSHGDFLRRRVSDAFVAVWDPWLQHCLADSRAALGDRWLDVFLTSPVWRFACAEGVAGPEAVVGVVAPSVDRVGRCFPLTIVAPSPGLTPALAAVEASQFYERATQLVVDTFETELVDFERFDADVVSLGVDLARVRLPGDLALAASVAAALDNGAGTAWHVPLGGPDELSRVLVQLAAHRMAARYAPLTLWWTEGSAAVEPGCLVAAGLPRPAGYAAMLDGSWARHGWDQLAQAATREAPEVLSSDTVALGFRSAARSDIGRVRRVNQDAFVDRAEIGLWGVADGMGGHADGEVASRMVCEALSDGVAAPTLDAMVDDVRHRLIAVNRELQRRTDESLLADVCGSTVVVLLARGGRAAVVWAGDSRVYRCRDGQLEQLTTDHSAPGPPGRAEVSGVTRAVGAAPDLELEVRRQDVRAGDRFVLCSDGLSRVVPLPSMAQIVALGEVAAVADALIASALAAGAPDNVTVTVVDAYAATSPTY